MFSSIMAPGCVHFVLTLQPSFAIGGHMILPNSFSQSLRCYTWEKHCRNITNTSHRQVGLAYFKLLHHYYSLKQLREEDGSGQPASLLLFFVLFPEHAKQQMLRLSIIFPSLTNFMRLKTCVDTWIVSLHHPLHRKK